MLPLTLFKRKYVVTQTAAGGGALTLRLPVPTGGLLQVDHLSVGPDDYAVGGRTVSARVENEDGETVAHLQTGLAAVDNQKVPLGPSYPVASSLADGVERAYGHGWFVYGGDVVEVDVAALVQNETLTVYLRGRTLGSVPTAATTGSAGVPTLAETER